MQLCGWISKTFCKQLDITYINRIYIIKICKKHLMMETRSVFVAGVGRWSTDWERAHTTFWGHVLCLDVLSISQNWSNCTRDILFFLSATHSSVDKPQIHHKDWTLTPDTEEAWINNSHIIGCFQNITLEKMPSDLSKMYIYPDSAILHPLSSQ